MRPTDPNKAIDEYIMLESSVTWCEQELNERIYLLEQLPFSSDEAKKIKKEMKTILGKLNVERRNIDNYLNENEENF